MFLFSSTYCFAISYELLTAVVIFLSKYLSKAKVNKNNEKTDIKSEGIRVNKEKNIMYFLEGSFLLLIFIVLRILPLGISSFLMGKLSSLIGPRLGVTKKAYNNIKNVMPEKNEKVSKSKLCF